MTYTDTALVEMIATNLRTYQEVLVENALSGYSENQSVAPSVTLSFAELSRLTNRRMIRTSLIQKLIKLLEDEELEVEQEREQLVITQPAKDLPTEFDSLRDLQRVLKSTKAKKLELFKTSP